MPSNSSLRVKAEALRELKAQYYVGSQSAWRYMKAMNWYEKVRDEVMKDPAVRGKHKPTVREIACLVPAIRSAVEHWLNFLSVKASTPENLSFVTEHHLVSPFEIEGVSDKDEKTFSGEYTEYTSHRWLFDDVLFMRQLLTFTPDALSGKVVTSPSAIGAFLMFMTAMGGVPGTDIESKSGNNASFLAFAATGERVSFFRFLAHTECSKFRQGKKENFDCEVAQIIDPWFIAQREDFVDAVGDDNPFDEGDEMSEAEVEALRKAHERGDMAYCHSVVQAGRLQVTQREFANATSGDLKAQVIGAEDWFYNSGLYWRAEQEHTLTLLEIERRIALNAVHFVKSAYGDLDSPQALVDFAIQFEGKGMQNAAGNLERNWHPNTPQLVRQNHANHWGPILRRYRYTLAALKKNRPWLIEFFSR